MKKPCQTSLFDEPDSAPDASTLVTIAKPKAKLTSAQRTFNRLTDQIRRQREALAAWDDYLPRFQKRLHAEYQPVLEKLREAQRGLVRQIDALLASRNKVGRLGRRDRKLLESQILAIIEDILVGGADDEMQRIHERYSGLSREEAQRMEMELTESFIGEVFGEDLISDHNAGDVEELLGIAGERFARREEEEAQKRKARQEKRTGKAVERKAQAEREASQSVRDIYRKLASGLHPDRETDAAERERKTQLMQRANQAYEANDLLTLLTLQMEAEQIDTGHLADVPGKQIAHYNRVLREQLKALQGEVQQRMFFLAGMLTMDLDRMFSRPFSRPKDVDVLLTERVAEVCQMVRSIEKDRDDLADSKSPRGLLDALRAEEELSSLDTAFFGALDEIFGADEDLSPRRRGKRRR